MNHTVYQGIWTNWSRGPILGSTLTTTKEYGNLLIAFTALFLAFVASRLWRIICLILHRYCSTPLGSAIHHQRQVVLRNSANPESALIETLSILWAWRKLNTRKLIGLVSLSVFTIIYLTAFTIASGFSSSISTAISDEVLIRSGHCGPIVVNTTMDGDILVNRVWDEVVNNAENYAQQCYNANQTSTAPCNRFVMGRLPLAVANSSSVCPFQRQICRNPLSALRLDSGYVDSNNHLGLNAPRDKRFALRYVLNCAPLKTDGYASRIVDYGRGFDRYHYGNAPLGPQDNRTGLNDFIYEVQDLDLQYINRTSGSFSGFDFKLK